LRQHVPAITSIIRLQLPAQVGSNERNVPIAANQQEPIERQANHVAARNKVNGSPRETFRLAVEQRLRPKRCLIPFGPTA